MATIYRPSSRRLPSVSIIRQLTEALLNKQKEPEDQDGDSQERSEARNMRHAAVEDPSCQEEQLPAASAKLRNPSAKPATKARAAKAKPTRRA